MINRYLRQCEDSLTGSVFTHLLSLPSEVFWQILRASCYSNTLPELAGEPEAVEFWPKWDPEGTGNTSYVEPDVFIRFSSFDLIIEAKRWDDKQQSERQWRAQARAYLNEYGEERELQYIALGGLHRVEPDALTDPLEFTVTKARWQNLLREVRQCIHDYKQHKHACAQHLAHIRILEHLKDLLAWHGFAAGSWYEDFDFKPNLGISYPAPGLPTPNFSNQ